MMKVSDANSQPFMGAAFGGWERPLKFLLIKEQIIDGVVKELVTCISCKGVVQPLEPRKLILKPEGQRSWTWLQIHIVGQTCPLKNNDRIEYKGRRHKVMALLDYTQNNYTELHLVEDFQNE